MFDYPSNRIRFYIVLALIVAFLAFIEQNRWRYFYKFKRSNFHGTVVKIEDLGRGLNAYYFKDTTVYLSLASFKPYLEVEIGDSLSKCSSELFLEVFEHPSLDYWISDKIFIYEYW